MAQDTGQHMPPRKIELMILWMECQADIDLGTCKHAITPFTYTNTWLTPWITRVNVSTISNSVWFPTQKCCMSIFANRSSVHMVSLKILDHVAWKESEVGVSCHAPAQNKTVGKIATRTHGINTTQCGYPSLIHLIVSSMNRQSN